MFPSRVAAAGTQKSRLCLCTVLSAVVGRQRYRSSGRDEREKVKSESERAERAVCTRVQQYVVGLLAAAVASRRGVKAEEEDDLLYPYRTMMPPRARARACVRQSLVRLALNVITVPSYSSVIPLFMFGHSTESWPQCWRELGY